MQCPQSAVRKQDWVLPECGPSALRRNGSKLGPTRQRAATLHQSNGAVNVDPIDGRHALPELERGWTLRHMDVNFSDIPILFWINGDHVERHVECEEGFANKSRSRRATPMPISHWRVRHRAIFPAS
jgi:hypothetical protein